MGQYKGVLPRGNSIQISFSWAGNRYREVLRWPPTAKNLRAANSLRTKIIYEIDKGTYNHNTFINDFPNSLTARKLAETKGDHLVISRALVNWIAMKEPYLEKSTYRDYLSAIEHHLSPRFGILPVSSLKPREVKEWLSSLSISNKRKNNIIIPLRQCFRDLYLDEIIDSNPLERVPNLSVAQKEPNPFNNSEVERILQALTLLGGEHYRNVYQFSFFTGLRTSELIALQWDDVDFENNRIHIKRAKVRGIEKGPKTNSGKRFVDLLPEAKAALNSQHNLRITGLNEVFYNNESSKPYIDDQQLRKTIWKPALALAGVEYRTPYQTRHTYASTLLCNGVEPMYVANQMGHSDWGMIRKVYGRWINSNKDKK